MSLLDDLQPDVINNPRPSVHIQTAIFHVFFQTFPKQRHFKLLFLTGI